MHNVNDDMSPVNIVKYIGGGIYILLILFAVVFLIYGTRTTRKFTKQTSFLLLVLLQSSIRCAFFFIPVTCFRSIVNLGIPWGVALQMTLDLLPETCFFLVFVLLCITWVQLICRSRNPKLFPKAHFVIATAVGMGAVVLTVVGLIVGSLAVRAPYGTAFAWQGWWNAALAIALCAAFLTVGIIFVCTVRRRPVCSRLVKRAASRVGVTSVVICVALAVRAVYVNILNSLIARLRKEGVVSEAGFAVVFFFYFFLTEVLPLAAVIAISVRPLKGSDPRLVSQHPVALNPINSNAHTPPGDTAPGDDTSAKELALNLADALA